MSKVDAKFLVSLFSAMPLETLNAELAHQGLEAMPTQGSAASMLAGRVRNGHEVCAVMLNLTDGAIKPDVMTDVMAKALPGSKVGDRHGHHYMSLARNGKLGGEIAVRCIPGLARKAKAEPAAVQSLSLADLSPEVLEKVAALVPPESELGRLIAAARPAPAPAPAPAPEPQPEANPTPEPAPEREAAPEPQPEAAPDHSAESPKERKQRLAAERKAKAAQGASA